MPPSHDAITQHWAERLCWEAARRDAARSARHLYRQPGVDGVSRVDEGAVLEDVFHFVAQLGVRAWLAEVHGAASQRDMRPFIP